MNANQKTYPRLARSYKHVYPFKIGTTSFIYPDHYLANVELLGPFLDEVELLFFESAEIDTLLSPSFIEKLRLLAIETALSYNIHLPTDISISHPDPQHRQKAAEIMIKIINRAAPLCPSTHTLHLPFTENSFDSNSVRKWQERIYESVEEILIAGIKGDSISIETLDYPFDLVAGIVSDMNLTICLDLGHLILNGDDFERKFDEYCDDIAIIHLHGVSNGRDHLSIDRLPEKHLVPVFRILRQFDRSLSLEVFGFDDLSASLAVLQKHWDLSH